MGLGFNVGMNGDKSERQFSANLKCCRHFSWFVITYNGKIVRRIECLKQGKVPLVLVWLLYLPANKTIILVRLLILCFSIRNFKRINVVTHLDIYIYIYCVLELETLFSYKNTNSVNVLFPYLIAGAGKEKIPNYCLKIRSCVLYWLTVENPRVRVSRLCLLIMKSQASAPIVDTGKNQKNLASYLMSSIIHCKI